MNRFAPYRPSSNSTYITKYDGQKETKVLATVGMAVGFKDDIETYGVIVKIEDSMITAVHKDSRTGEEISFRDSADRFWVEA